MAFWPGFLDPDEIERIREDVARVTGPLSPYGIRNAEKKFPSFAALATSSAILNQVLSVLDAPPRLLRAIFFDKTPETNWYVTWHQDKTIAVDEPFEFPGWGPWSVKDGVHHVQPPRKILERVITLRIHLDDTDESNGCLTVIPGSHRRGIIPVSEIDTLVSQGTPLPCVARAGDALVMRPLLLHASRRATSPSHRRVVHLEFGDFELPDRPSPSREHSASPR